MLADLLDALGRLPSGTLVPAHELRRMIADYVPPPPLEPATVGPVADISSRSDPPGWRERLWQVPDDTRLAVREVADAIGKSRSWVYARTAPSTERIPIPHRKLDGELVFVAHEIRAWLQQVEVISQPALVRVQRRRRERMP